MTDLLRSYNANAVKQVLRTAQEMGTESGSLKVQMIIRQMIQLCDDLDKAISKQIIFGTDAENAEFLKTIADK